MKKNLLLSVIVSFFAGLTSAQDTFSICAIDSVTKEVGSAGASCINGSVIISDVHPGIGVVHTQAYWQPGNQSNAQAMMDAGLSPQQIIDSLIKIDVESNPSIRQYGIVDLVNNGRSAGYTGINCSAYKNHITGKTYAIQGNILLGQQILDSMEARFKREPGDLACKLMAALQGANVIGADTRCTSYGTSTKSAFIKVAKPTDIGSYYLELEVPSVPQNKEPIDSLQKLFNAVHSCPVGIKENQRAPVYITVLPNYQTGDILLRSSELLETGSHFEILDNQGKILVAQEMKNRKEFILYGGTLPAGIYLYRLQDGKGNTAAGKIVVVQ